MILKYPFTPSKKFLKGEFSFHVIARLAARYKIGNCITDIIIQAVDSHSFNGRLAIRARLLPQTHELFQRYVKKPVFILGTALVYLVFPARAFSVSDIPRHSVRVFFSSAFALAQFFGRVLSFGLPHLFDTFRRKFMAFAEPILVSVPLYKTGVAGFHI